MVVCRLIRPDSLENEYKNGKIVGFKFAVRIADYRGCFLSLHNGYYVTVDGVEYPRDVQAFEINGKAPRSFDEIKTCVWEHWDYDDEGYLHIAKEGGLSPGTHKIGLQQCVLAQYGYWPHDQEWIENPPMPGSGLGGGKVQKVVYFDLALQAKQEGVQA